MLNEELFSKIIDDLTDNIKCFTVGEYELHGMKMYGTVGNLQQGVAKLVEGYDAVRVLHGIKASFKDNVIKFRLGHSSDALLGFHLNVPSEQIEDIKISGNSSCGGWKMKLSDSTQWPKEADFAFPIRWVDRTTYRSPHMVEIKLKPGECNNGIVILDELFINLPRTKPPITEAKPVIQKLVVDSDKSVTLKYTGNVFRADLYFRNCKIDSIVATDGNLKFLGGAPLHCGLLGNTKFEIHFHCWDNSPVKIIYETKDTLTWETIGSDMFIQSVTCEGKKNQLMYVNYDKYPSCALRYAS